MKGSMLVAAMTRLDEDRVLTLVKHKLESGVLPLDIIEEVREGMARVGQMYEKGIYFLGDLMMCAEIFMEAAEFLKINNAVFEQVAAPPIVIGTVRNDIHDIGKNIMVQFLLCNGLKAVDLGVNVSPGTFVRSVEENSPKILCMSGLLTSSYESMRLTVDELEKNNLRNGIKVIIGGLVNEQVRQFVGADYWIKDSTEGISICRSILSSREQALIS